MLVQLTQALTMAVMVSCGRRDLVLTYYTNPKAFIAFQVYREAKNWARKPDNNTGLGKIAQRSKINSKTTKL